MEIKARAAIDEIILFADPIQQVEGHLVSVPPLLALRKDVKGTVGESAPSARLRSESYRLVNEGEINISI